MAFAMGFVSCQEDVTLGTPQNQPQEPIMSAEGITVANGEAITAGAVNLQDMSDTETLIPVIKVVENQNFPAESSLMFKMQLAKSEDFSKTSTVDVTMDGNTGYVAPADWQKAHLEIFGKSPKAQEAHVRFAAYAVNGTSQVRIGNPELYYGQGMVSVTPFAPELFIDEVYHLVVNGEVCGTFKNTGGDVYDNPTFTAKVNIPEENFDEETFSFGVWKVISDRYKETGDASAGRAVFAPAPESAGQPEGSLVTNSGSGDIPEGDYLAMAGSVIFTVNVESMTFSIAEAPKTMYMIGQFCGWIWDNAAEMTPVWGNPDKYWTIRYVKGDTDNGFKFNANNDWDGGEWGYGGATIGTNVAGEIVDAGGNLSVTKSGWYIFVVDVSSGTPVLDILEPNVYVFGAAIGNKWSAEESNKFTVIDDPDAEWPFVSPDVTATDGTDSSCLRLCVQLPGHEWWHTEFVFYSDGNIVYRGTGGDQSRTGNDAGKIYLNFVTNKGKAE